MGKHELAVVALIQSVNTMNLGFNEKLLIEVQEDFKRIKNTDEYKKHVIMHLKEDGDKEFKEKHFDKAV